MSNISIQTIRHVFIYTHTIHQIYTYILVLYINCTCMYVHICIYIYINPMQIIYVLQKYTYTIEYRYTGFPVGGFTPHQLVMKTQTAELYALS